MRYEGKHEAGTESGFSHASEMSSLEHQAGMRESTLLLAVHEMDPGQFSLGDTYVEPGKRRELRSEVAAHLPSPREMSELLQGVPTPLDTGDGKSHAEEVLGFMGERERKVLAYFAKDEINQGPEMNVRDVDWFAKYYPDLVNFRNKSFRFLNEIEFSDGKEKRAVYASALNNFEQIMFGDQVQIMSDFEHEFGPELEKDVRWSRSPDPKRVGGVTMHSRWWHPSDVN
jgi:hypothetical protein